MFSTLTYGDIRIASRPAVLFGLTFHGPTFTPRVTNLPSTLLTLKDLCGDGAALYETEFPGVVRLAGSGDGAFVL
jgi:hypothetical protein